MITKLRQIRNLLKDALVGKVKTFYIGKPDEIPDNALNALYIRLGTDNIRIEDTRDDLHELEIFIGVCVQKGLPTSSQMNSQEKGDLMKIIEIMQGEDSTGDLASNSVVGVMRKRLQSDNILNSVSLETRESTVDYNTPVERIDNEMVMCREARFGLTFLDNVTTTNNG